MKGRYLLAIFSIAVLLIACGGTQQLTGEEVAKAAQVKSMVESKNYVFKARNATPMGGQFIQLTSDYEVRVSPDTVVTFLPYFGRAFVAPINPAKGGIMITSSDFKHNVGTRRSGWDVTIKPEDTRDVRSLQLSITASGNASLQVLFNNKQPIRFNGHIEAGRTR